MDQYHLIIKQMICNLNKNIHQVQNYKEKKTKYKN